MTDELVNQAAVVGHNEPPDHGKMAHERMLEEYGGVTVAVEKLLAEAREAPKTVNDDETAGQLAKLVKRLRDVAAQCGAYHKKEKEPYLRAGQAVDRYFFGLIEKCARRQRTDKPGAADILQARIDEFMQRKLAEERRQREEEARKAREAEEEATRKRLAEQAAADAARLAADRARKPENIEAHTERAEQHQTAADTARLEENTLRDRTMETAQAAAAKPSAMVGRRVSDDVKLTMRTEAYCEVTDVEQLDKDVLWAFVDDAAKVKACKSWAKTTGHKRQMAGATIGHREVAVVR